MAFTYQYARPALTVDCVVFGLDAEALKILLIERANPPFEGCWALPGGFAEVGESLDDSARRELEEETGVKGPPFEQLHVFSDPARDPREHVVTVAYYALVNRDEHRVQAADDARKAAWFGLDALPPLAFDHDRILAMAIDRLREKVRRQPLGRELLPERFSLSQLQALYRKILGRPLDPARLAGQLAAFGVLVETDGAEERTGAERLYHFDRNGYEEMQRRGFQLDL